MGGIGPYVWDDLKHALNLAAHEVDFEAALSFEWERSIIWQDNRHDYGEKRFLALGGIQGRIHGVHTAWRIFAHHLVTQSQPEGSQAL